jgi:hypothetical protein
MKEGTPMRELDFATAPSIAEAYEEIKGSFGEDLENEVEVAMEEDIAEVMQKLLDVNGDLIFPRSGEVKVTHLDLI